jgi:alkylation response protein AidB-like acyl-CoA dehydrogenase
MTVHETTVPPGRVTDPPDAVLRARRLGPAIIAAAEAIEATQRIPEPLLSELHAARLCRLLLPRSIDGEEVPPWVYLHAVEEISRHDASVGWNVFVANSSALIAPFLPAETARTIFADPRALVSWGPPNACTARAVPGGYRLSGEWHFASGSRQATWMGAHCQVVEPDGSRRRGADGRPVTRTLLFPADRAERIADWNVIGLRGTASEGYRVADLFVPEDFSATREDPAARRERGRLFAFTMQGLYAVGAAGVACGIARAMLDAFIALATRKSPRGLGRLADSASVQGGLARQEAGLGAARAYLVATLAEIWAEAGETGAIDIPARARVRLACAQALAQAVAAADFAYKAAGVDAIFLGSAFERRFRDIHTLSQQIQARDAHFEAVGAILLGIVPEVFY